MINRGSIHCGRHHEGILAPLNDLPASAPENDHEADDERKGLVRVWTDELVIENLLEEYRQQHG